MQSAERYTTALSNAVAAQLGGAGLMWLWSLQDTRNRWAQRFRTEESHLQARQLPDLQAAMFVNQLQGWIALPTFQGAVCYGAVYWPGHGRHPNTLGNDCSRLEAHNGGAAWLKVEVDKNWGEDNQGEAVNRRHRHWRPWSSLPLRSFFHWRQQVIKWRVLMTSLAEEYIFAVLQKLVKATSNNFVNN